MQVKERERERERDWLTAPSLEWGALWALFVQEKIGTVNEIFYPSRISSCSLKCFVVSNFKDDLSHTC